eukprot:m.144940 g.144940  ORF g.144940 m.144940 type:complete len:287 (-) comp14933_c0_seq4:80-940(-)
MCTLKLPKHKSQSCGRIMEILRRYGWTVVSIACLYLKHKISCFCTFIGLDGLQDLMVHLQPQAVGTPKNPTGWCGTESGHPSKDVGPGDVWSTGSGFFGDPNSSQWMPKFCDPQLFQEHVWFWEPNLHVRTLGMMIPIYHDIVGRGMVMELAFSIDRDGLVDPTHEPVYKALGAWVRSCYGTPLVETSGSGNEFYLTVPEGATFDRVQIQEDIVTGQRVREYAVEVSSGAGWTSVAAAKAIGRKRIFLMNSTMTATSNTTLRLSLSNAIATPNIKQFAVFKPCPSE